MTSEKSYDAVVIGSGLGGLTAAALLARVGRRVIVLERNRSFGGAASIYRVGALDIEASLHETADPRDAAEPKHAILARLGLLDSVPWVGIDSFQTVVGGPVGAPLVLGHGFASVTVALAERFPGCADGIGRLMSRMDRLNSGLARLTAAGEARSPAGLVMAAPALLPALRDWRLSLAEALQRDLGDCEGAKCALGANLPYYHDDPASTWWLLFAIAQAGYIASGGVYVRGGSASLSRALVKALKSAGGEIVLGRRASAIELGGDGRPAGVLHVGKEGGDPVRVATRTVLSSGAPDQIAEMLPENRRAAFRARYAGLAPSISLFSAHFGLAEPPQKFGLGSYSTILLPDWMQRLDDYARAGALLGAPPGRELPPLTVVNYAAIDAGLGSGERSLVTVVGVDRVSNWTGAGREAEEARRTAWLAAILDALERRYPGFAGAVREQILITARSMRDYLGTPEGAVYGFAPAPPTSLFRRGAMHGPRTPVPGLLLCSAFGGSGGFTGVMMAGAAAARAVEQSA
ncbi:MAG: NAD(P)/FAD-dependent oxidoreductase [Pseudomonadota bacterium]